MKATALQWLRSKFPRLAPQNISIPLYLFQALDSINKLPVEQQAQFLIDSIKNNPEGKIKVVEIHEKLHFIKADEIIGEKSYNKYFIINQGNLSLNHELLKPLNYSLELASNTTKVDLDSLSKSDQRLVKLVRLAKEEGLKESDIYETYLKRYKEKLDLPSDTIKSFLSSQDQITCQIVDEKVIYFQKGEEENGEDTPSSNAAVVVDDHTTKQIDESDTSSKFQKAQPSPIRNKANNEKKIVNYLRYNILKRYFTALGETHFSFENQQYIALDLEGFNETLTDYSLAQLSLGDGTSAILFDHQQGKEDVQKALLSHLTNAKDLQYIFIHACHSDVAALSSSFVDDLHRNNKCFIDTQLVYEFFHQNRFNSFSDCLEFFNPSSQTKDENSRKYLIKSKMRNDPHYWHRRPLSLEQIQYAALDVVSLHQTIPLILEKIERLGQEMNVNLLSVFLRATEKRIANVFKGIQHTVVFDEETFHPISRELAESLAEHLPDSKYSRLINQFDRSIQSISSTARLLKLFPERYLPFLDIPILNTSVCDIVLDKGRAPFLRMMDNSRQDLFPDQPEYKFTRDDLVSIIENLNGGFGSDNRTGVEGELHRISAIRSKKAVSPRNPHDNIIGLTIRIGRYFVGNSYIISDLLFQEMHRGKSILVLGPPGSGKTSVIREIARQMSRVHHVMIVDTSNEICGDSDVPHDCVGNARRMVVPEIDDQHRVMIECVQNHTPEVMIIDEIGRTKEVKAAQTCKQRGVRLIASAHGDLRSLLKNGELNGLLGGVVPVILGDVAANKTKSGKKVIEQRSGAPIFDIIIEVIKGNYSAFRITTDSGKAVDLLLDGREGNAEYRERRTIASVNKDESPSQIIQTSFVKI